VVAGSSEILASNLDQGNQQGLPSRSEQPSRASAVLAHLVVGIGHPAAVDGQAATSHTVGEVVAELLEMAYSLVELGLPGLGYPLPVAPGGSAAIRQ
jgi:hypothetical protein